MPCRLNRSQEIVVRVMKKVNFEAILQICEWVRRTLPIVKDRSKLGLGPVWGIVDSASIAGSLVSRHLHNLKNRPNNATKRILPLPVLLRRVYVLHIG